MSPDLHALICDRIQRFSSQCEDDEYTDTDEVWALLDFDHRHVAARCAHLF